MLQFDDQNCKMKEAFTLYTLCTIWLYTNKHQYTIEFTLNSKKKLMKYKLCIVKLIKNSDTYSTFNSIDEGNSIWTIDYLSMILFVVIMMRFGWWPKIGQSKWMMRKKRGQRMMRRRATMKIGIWWQISSTLLNK